MRRSTYVAALVLCVGCSEGGLVGNGGPPEIAPPPDPIIEVSTGDEVTPHLLFLGDIEVGDERIGAVTVTNLGDGALELTELVPPSSGAWTIAGPELPLRLGIFDETTVDVTFRPLRDGEVLDSFTVVSNDPAEPAVAVRLAGSGGAPSIEVAPRGYDFGVRPLGCEEEVRITVANVGSRPLHVGEVSLDGVPLGLEGELPWPFTLEPTELTTIDFTWELLIVGQLRTTLRILSDDPEEPEILLPLVATGAPYTPHVDRFEQGGVSVADVLFVVDNSGSMGDEQTALATNFPAFVDIVEGVGMDYRLGVVTTDSAVLQGPPVEATDADPASTFAAQALVGSWGSGYELALDMAWQALDPSLGTNPGFLRDGAALDIVIVTDEPNQSFTFPTPLDWVTAFQGLRPDPTSVTISDITGGPSGCFGAGGSASAAPTFTQVSALTDGVSGLVCNADWSATLEELAWSTTGRRSFFELSEAPIPETIEVSWEGTVVAGWTYDADANAVVFSAGSVPGEGEIEVAYAVPQECDD